MSEDNNDANNNAKKTREQVLKENAFKPGQIGNPKGRPKGSRNKFSEAFIRDFLTTWEEGGKDALERVREKDPSTFIRVAASIIPKDFNINGGDATLERLLEQFSDTELDGFIAGISAIGDATESGKAKAQEGSPDRSSRVH